MRKILTIICALFVALLLPTSFLISQSLPTDTGSYIEQKYAGWNGVLQVWICCEWKCGGSFVSWLNRCASTFEKNHNGVYIELTAVDRYTMREMLKSNLRKPELILFSPGVLEYSAALATTHIPENLRSDLSVEPFAVPVVMGGYIWIFNTDLADGAPVRSDDLHLTFLSDENGRQFSCAALALLSEQPAEIIEEPVPDSGIDLGLPVHAEMHSEIVQSDDAFNRFVSGDLPWTIATQYELKKLDDLQQNGRAPNWKAAATGSFAWTDQLLYMSCVQIDGSFAQERSDLIEAFARLLLGQEAQQMLGEIGAFSVTGEWVHSSASIYAQLEKLLTTRSIIVENAFPEYYQRDSAKIVREYCAGILTISEAFEKMGIKTSLPIYPN